MRRLLIHSLVGEDGADSRDLRGGAVKPCDWNRALLLCCVTVGLAHRAAPSRMGGSAPALEGVLLDSACSAVSLSALATDRDRRGVSRASKLAMWKGRGDRERSRSVSLDMACSLSSKQTCDVERKRNERFRSVSLEMTCDGITAVTV